MAPGADGPEVTDLRDALALRETHDRLSTAAAHAAREQTVDEGLVEDAASEAMGALFGAVTAPNPPDQVVWDQYVRVAARNYARRVDQRLKKSQPAGQAGSAVAHHDDSSGSGGAAELEAALQDLGRAGISTLVAGAVNYDQLVDQLPPGERVMVVGKYVDGLSTAELAAAHGVTEKAVENRLRHGRQRLLEVLQASRH